MFGLENLDALFVIWAFLFQIILIVHFALRKWRFDVAIRYGPIVYALGLPAVAISIALLHGGKTWSLWLGGFIYFVWAVLGYLIEYVKKIHWRNPLRWSILGPYVLLVPGCGHVLLVTPCNHPPTAMVCVCGSIRYQHDTQCHIAQGLHR